MASNRLGQGHYPQLTRFEEPWEFFIIDNFLNQDTYKKIWALKNKDLFKFADEYNGQINVGTNTLSKESGNYPHKKFIDLNAFSDIMDNLYQCVSDKVNNLLPNPFFLVSDFVRCQPGYRYGKHKDHVDKYISIVIYFGSMGNATTLISNNNVGYNIGWKQNRAVLFLNSNHGAHSYTNTTKEDRYTLNIYVTKEEGFKFCVKTLPLV